MKKKTPIVKEDSMELTEYVDWDIALGTSMNTVPFYGHDVELMHYSSKQWKRKENRFIKKGASWLINQSLPAY